MELRREANALFTQMKRARFSEAQALTKSLTSTSGSAAASSAVRRATALRVLAVIPGQGQGHSFVFARRQVESLAKLGVAIRVFYLASRTSLVGLSREWVRLRQTLVDFKPDVVHAHYGAITSFLCACTARCPVVITFRGSDLNGDPSVGLLRTRLGFLFSQLSTLQASAIVCTSHQLWERLWWRKNKVLVLPSGVDLTLFQPYGKQECRRILGWDPQERVVLFNVGGAPMLKGLGLAREAVAIAQRNLGPIRFIELNGDVLPDRIPTYLNGADCLVVASESEGSPNILKEALACNLPVASVDVGDVAERLSGVSPSRVVPRNARALGGAIIEILESRKRSNGRAKVQDCSQDKVAETLNNLYRSVAQWHD